VDLIIASAQNGYILVAMEKVVRLFSRVVSYILISIAMVFCILQLVSIISESVEAFGRHLPAQGEAFFPAYVLKVITIIFSALLLLAIMNTIRVFGREYDVKMRTTIIVCMVGIARRLSLMQYSNESFLEEAAIIALVFALTMAYFLMRQEKHQLLFGNMWKRWMPNR